MSQHLSVIRTHGSPSDDLGPYAPVQPAIRGRTTKALCHRCDQLAIPDLVHLADAAYTPLCPACTQHIGPPIRRGLSTLNQLAGVFHQPDAHPARLLVHDWRAALRLARAEESQLLLAAARLLARHAGYQSPLAAQALPASRTETAERSTTE